MGQGIEIFDANGKLQFNGEMLTYALRASGQAAVASRKVGNTSNTSLMIPSTNTFNQAIVALSGGAGWAAAYAGTWNPDGQRVYATGNAPVGTVFNYYIFERSNTIPPSTFGLEVRNANNEITFSSNQRAMRVLDVLGNPDRYDASVNPALTIAGKSLAFACCAFAGHRFSGELQVYIGGALAADAPPGAPGDPNYSYKWSNDGKVYGGAVTNNGQTVTSRAITWDDVTAGPTSDPTQPPDAIWPQNMFVVDVTGFPVGGTFF